MHSSTQKIVQYLGEAHASEQALVRVLQSQIAMTPRGSYRSALETHLDETRDHAQRVQRRLGRLSADARTAPLAAAVTLAESLLGQALALSKTPLDLLRGTGGEEKVLKNAKDACATEALEIATYTAIERLARAVGDDETAELAASIRADEERMLARILREIPQLTSAVVGADIDGEGTYDLASTGTGEAVKRTVTGAPVSQEELAISGYDELTVAEINAVLNEGDEGRNERVLIYERDHKSRAGVLRAARRLHSQV